MRFIICKHCGKNISLKEEEHGIINCPHCHGINGIEEKDPINPSHYKEHPSGIECIEITRHMNFNLGNAMKYIWRADLKGSSIEDLEKASWYLNDEIQKRKKVGQ